MLDTALSAAFGRLVKAVNRAAGPKSPSYTRTAGILTRIDYADGSYKTLTYNSGKLVRTNYVKDGVTVRKDFTYTNGDLVSVTESVV